MDCNPVILNLEQCQRKRRRSDAELQEAATDEFVLFLLSIMKLKKVERLCREVWRSCQQVCFVMQATTDKVVKEQGGKSTNACKYWSECILTFEFGQKKRKMKKCKVNCASSQPLWSYES